MYCTYVIMHRIVLTFTENQELIDKLERVSPDGIDAVDLLIGMYS